MIHFGQTKAAVFVSLLYSCSNAVADNKALRLDLSSEIRKNGDTTSTIIGAITAFHFDPRNSFKIFLNQTERDSNDIENFGFSYQLNYSDKNNISLQLSNTATEAGTDRDIITLAANHKTTATISNISLTRRATKDANTQTDLQFQTTKLFNREHRIPYSMIGRLKLRHRDVTNGENVTAVGGTVALRLKPFNDFTLNATHNFKDEISAESTTLAGVYSKNISGYGLTFEARSDDLVYVKLLKRFTARQ